MSAPNISIRAARPEEYAEIGRLLVQVYAQLEGFPKPEEQPAYYSFLANIGAIADKPGAALLVAVTEEQKLAGVVVYVGDMRYYSPLGVAADEPNAAGFRLLAVAPWARGLGLGRQLTQECIRRATAQGAAQVILHSTQAMQLAWQLYERMGFRRAEELDFLQQGFPVYGFRLRLT